MLFFFVWLFVCLFGWLVGLVWLFGRSVGRLVGWLVGCCWPRALGDLQRAAHAHGGPGRHGATQAAARNEIRGAVRLWETESLEIM